jgi:hypothetical protein
MKKKFAPHSAPVRRSVDEGGFFKLGASIGLFVFLAGAFLLALGELATANPLQLASRMSADGSAQANA